jgi:hypothetical protein
MEESSARRCSASEQLDQGLNNESITEGPDVVSSEIGQERKQSTGFVGCVVAISLVVSIGGVIGGYSHGFPSPTLLGLQQRYERGERVTAFSSSSVYAGLFGVSLHPI